MNPWLHIDLSALNHNFDLVRACSHGQGIMAVIKANAYGHGMEMVQLALQEQVDAFAVARIDEALALRQSQFEKTILVLTGAQNGSELAAAAEHDLYIVIHQQQQLELIKQSPYPLAGWLKLDTGMNRLGFKPEQFAAALQLAQKIKNFRLIGLMSHLACADQPDHPLNSQQIQQFEQLTAHLDYPRSLANSAGILYLPQSHYDWLRPGLMLYGAAPNGQPDERLRAVMRLYAPIIATKTIKKGESIGYGASWQAPENMPVGIIGIGYGDGYPRQISDAAVWLDGHLLPIIGRISMDSLAIDLRSYPQARIGEAVQLWGEYLPIEKIAAQAQTIAYTLMTAISPRVSKHYLW